ncbi:MAG: hypothetical protein RRC07_05295 [Anaerolineae bacterium]|nr:hypothetical protein [Anaerolineae bacterium]
MFGSLERSLATYRVELFSADYFMRAQFQPLGELLVFLNDRQREFVRLDEVELVSLTAERQLRAIQREAVSVNKRSVQVVSVPDAAEAERVQVIAAHRPVVFYFGPLIVRGQLHVNVEALPDDLLDDSRDFYPVSAANIYYMRAAAPQYTREVPLLFVNRQSVQTYHIQPE